MSEQPNLAGQPTTEETEAQTPPSRGGRIASEVFEFIWETVKVVLIALVIILPVRYFLIQPFFVKGESMFPTYHDKEYILVDKWTYRTARPQRGDVIVFKAPTDVNDYFIKRIVGLPGERVVVQNNTVRVFNAEFPDGFTLNEKVYLPDSHITEGTDDRLLEDDEYYVLGDNRQHSSDSRAFGPVRRELFSGMSWLRLWPLERIDFLERTTYPPVIE
ncbi:MAG TPA: signal peptidase I [Candidatus Paceibacterota bacterium]|nr:signal peptidase I [Candidatus Paceibacterota bacterium]